MPSLKTSEHQSIEPASFAPEPRKTTIGKKMFRSITEDHVLNAMTNHLRSLSMIDDNEQVTVFNKTREGYEVKIDTEKFHD